MKPSSVVFVLGIVASAQIGWSAQVSSPRPSAMSSALGLARSQPLAGRHGLFWAAQLDWSPGGAGGLLIQYNASGRPSTAPPNAYRGTVAAVLPRRGVWRTQTWKLTQVDFGGRQNGGADLRLMGTPGIAVHRITLSLRAPETSGTHGTGAANATVLFNTGRIGQVAVNTDRHMRQVLAGGNTIDSLYRCGVIAGQTAEIFTGKKGREYYIYLRLNRRSRLFRAHPRTVYATVTYTVTQAPPHWRQRDFARMAARGVDVAELLVAWSAVEPQPGRFDFRELDQTLANAAKAHVHVVLVFLFSGWPGDPAPWITHDEIGSTGATSAALPTWWNRFNRRSYFTYLTRTIAHVKHDPVFGGAFLNFGWLDGIWGGPGTGATNINGYAAADVACFHRRWLPAHYRSIGAFNQRYHTRFKTWNAIPAAKPGQPLFSVYQHFRHWSVVETVRHMMALARRETQAPLYYYWGGACAQAGITFNMPDTFFQMARRYHVTLCLDDADGTGQALVFASLAQAYGAPFLEEWTPWETAAPRAEMARFLGHYGLEAPQAGMDFFAYSYHWPLFPIAWPMYVRWIPFLSRIHGVYPLQPVALYISFRSAFTKPLGPVAVAPRSFIETRLSRIWHHLHLAFTVVTDREVHRGVVHLHQFRAILPLNGRHDAVIRRYAAQGGHVLRQARQLSRYAPVYLTFTPASGGHAVEAVPTVDRAARTAWITFSGWKAGLSYRGVACLHLNGLGLPLGLYHVRNAVTGRPIPARVSSGEIQAPLDIAPGDLQLWEIMPGPRGPATPPASATVGRRGG